MPSLAAIRERRRSDRPNALRRGATAVPAGHPGGEVWLYSCGETFGYGSLARGDWDACSDVDLLGDEVLALTQAEWQRLRAGDDPEGRAIGRDALRLDRP
jgi:hypothetical protein